MTGGKTMDHRAHWGPSPKDPPLVVVKVARWGPSLLQQVQQIEAAVEVPVQAVRGDRVFSWEHLLAARWHAERALRVGRSRLQDPGVALICFLAAKRQISQALGELGVPLDRPGEVPVLLVALGEVEENTFVAQVEAVGLAPVRAGTVSFEDATSSSTGARGLAKDPGPGVMGAQARGYWAGRLGLDDAASDTMRRDRLLAKMALVSLEA